MKINFSLSGMGDVFLENAVHEAVENAGYPDHELYDTREPVQYRLSDFVCNFDNIEQRLPELKRLAILTPDAVVPYSIKNIRAFVKRGLARIFRWYTVPMAESQSCFNNEASAMISVLVFSLKTQKETIKQLQNELDEIRKKIV